MNRLIAVLMSLISMGALGECPYDPEVLSNGESARITIKHQDISTGAVSYFVYIPAQHNGKPLESVFLKIGDLLNDEGLVPLKVEPSDDGYMVHLFLQSSFTSGAYLHAKYGKCTFLGKTVKARDKPLDSTP